MMNAAATSAPRVLLSVDGKKDILVSPLNYSGVVFVFFSFAAAESSCAPMRMKVKGIFASRDRSRTMMMAPLGLGLHHPN